jgi:signal peptidase I
MKKNNKIGIVLIAFNITFIIVVFLNAGAVANIVDGTGIFGYEVIPTNGTSMEPNISDGDYVLVKNVDTIDSVDEGDVIGFDTSCELSHDDIIHRVVNETEYGLVTQGDNNSITDQHGFETDSYEQLDVDNVCHPFITDRNVDFVMVANVSEIPITDRFFSMVNSIVEMDKN